jgi:hypothetical protein
MQTHLRGLNLTVTVTFSLCPAFLTPAGGLTPGGSGAGCLTGLGSWELPGALKELDCDIPRRFLAAAESMDCLFCCEVPNPACLLGRRAGKDCRRLPAWVPTPLPSVSITGANNVYIKKLLFPFHQQAGILPKLEG